MAKAIVFLGLLIGALGVESKASEMICRVCGHPEYPPFMWNSNSQVLGLGKQLLSEALKTSNINLVTQFDGNWKRCLASLKVGSIDFVVSAYVTDQRKRYIDFTQAPVSQDPVHLFTWNKRSFAISNWSDLIGKKMVSLHGDSHGQRFDQFARKHIDIIEVNTVEQAFRMLESGRVDFIAGGLYPWGLRIKAHGYSDMITGSDYLIENQYLHIGVSKQSRCRKYLKVVEKFLIENSDQKHYEARLK